jgi:putative transposase
MEIKDKSKEYNNKYNLIYSCQYHVIFTPKYRRKVLVDGIDIRLKELIKNKENEYEYQILEMEIMSDHVHLLIDICPKIGVYQTITKIKGYTSRILRDEFPSLKSRIPTLWTRSSFISSVGSVSLQTVKEYIENQKYV